MRHNCFYQILSHWYDSGVLAVITGIFIWSPWYIRLWMFIAWFSRQELQQKISFSFQIKEIQGSSWTIFMTANMFYLHMYTTSIIQI